MTFKTKASALISKSFVAAGVSAVTVFATFPAQAAGGGPAIPRVEWSFDGPTGQFDRAQLQRGFQVYQNVCSACHGLSRLSWRNLVQPGGPEFPEEAVKALAKDWPNKITDGPNDAGEMFERDALLSDPILGPYKNEQAARAAQNGAYPPDLSLMARARNPEFKGSALAHGPHMMRDILTGYQAGGPDYLFALLTGYTDVPSYVREENGHLKPVGAEGAGGKAVEQCASVTPGEDGKPDVCNALADGMNYNAAFPGHQIAMPAILADGAVEYPKGPDGNPLVPATLDQHARDVSAFLAWAADPHLNQRKATGWQALLFLLVTTVLLFLGKKRIWSRIEH
ncbi:MAG: cytochrome c1 [Hyphomicrobium sp.]|nr:cytochrome c1 [Hyphomicrobium sp.]